MYFIIYRTICFYKSDNFKISIFTIIISSNYVSDFILDQAAADIDVEVEAVDFKYGG